MSGELIAIIGVGVAIATLIITTSGRLGQRLDGLGQRLDGLAAEMAALRERVAKLEGKLEGLLEWLRESPVPTSTDRAERR